MRSQPGNNAELIIFSGSSDFFALGHAMWGFLGEGQTGILSEAHITQHMGSRDSSVGLPDATTGNLIYSGRVGVNSVAI